MRQLFAANKRRIFSLYLSHFDTADKSIATLCIHQRSNPMDANEHKPISVAYRRHVICTIISAQRQHGVP